MGQRSKPFRKGFSRTRHKIVFFTEHRPGRNDGGSKQRGASGKMILKKKIGLGARERRVEKAILINTNKMVKSYNRKNGKEPAGGGGGMATE